MTQRGPGLVLLDLFCFGMDFLTKPTINQFFRDDEGVNARSLSRWLTQLEKEDCLQQVGEGKSARFVITATGRARASLTDPQQRWSRAWDGKWRGILFDLPLVSHTVRLRLWRSFRAEKLGLLQKSVWIWPHPLENVVMELVQAQGVPECFCGIEISRLFLSTNAEVVAAAWPWEEIRRRQRGYLQHRQFRPQALTRGADFAGMGRLLRAEREAYDWAFALDPQLPVELCPLDYQGQAVEARHQECRAALADRSRKLR